MRQSRRLAPSRKPPFTSLTGYLESPARLIKIAAFGLGTFRMPEYGAYRIGKDGKLISRRPMVCDDEKAALKRESKNSESSKFSDGSRVETFAWPRREVGREQATGETPSSSISSNKKCLARNAEKDERNSLEPARETLRPGDLRPEQRGNHGGGALECVQENPIKTIVRLVYAWRDLQQQGLHHCYGEASSRRPHCLNR